MTNAATLASLAVSGALSADSSGNVGIGTTSPTTVLDVQSASAIARLTSTTGTNGVTLRTINTGGTSYFGRDSSAGGFGAAYSTVVWGTGAYPMLFGTNDVERARIDSSGNFYIGATGQVVNTYLLTLNYSGNAQKGGIMFNDGDSGLTYEACYFRKDGAQRGYIRVATTGTTYATVSDYRLKENVQPMTGALAKVAALKPCTYTWKDSEISSQGFLAHELAEVVPECVTGEKDAVDEDGNAKYQGIDTSFLVATLTAAIQELKAEVDQLRAQLEAK